jgi:hypothetical protein
MEEDDQSGYVDKYAGLSREVSPWAISQLGLPGQARIGRVGKVALLIGALALTIALLVKHLA